MKLITEEVQKVKFITEGKGANKKMYIEGVFLQGDIKNRNGRMYPVNTLAREVGRYNESFIKKGRALGELGHPDGPTVNLDRVSHKITSLRQEGKNFIGKAASAPLINSLDIILPLVVQCLPQFHLQFHQTLHYPFQVEDLQLSWLLFDTLDL